MRDSRFAFAGILFALSTICATPHATAAPKSESGESPESLSIESDVTALRSIESPSGLPVPRFVALKKNKVRARFGPSFDYPIAYEFTKEGFPLKVIAEDRDDIWRRVEDRDGRKMWIHRSMLSANEHAVIDVDGAILRASPKQTARGRVKLGEGVMAKIETCKDGWCRLRADKFRGWLPAESLWGAPEKI